MKSAKLHFVDTGVAAYLLGIREPDQLRTHPLRGALFESWVASELVKQAAHGGLRRDLFHYRDTNGLEVDLVSVSGREVLLTEVKSGATVASDFTHAIERLADGLRTRDTVLAITTTWSTVGPLGRREAAHRSCLGTRSTLRQPRDAFGWRYRRDR